MPDLRGDDHQGHEISRMSCKKIVFFSTITCLVIGYISSHQSLYINKESTTENEPCFEDFFSVVFDAGSTGSRVFVFQFRLEDDGGKKGSVIKLRKEFHSSTEPGISSFAHDTSEVSVSLKPLLHHALKYIPEKHHSHTLLLFKATAGLRLLPEEISEKILNEVRSFLDESPFFIPDLKRVEVMGGDEEGIFGWVTANFLSGTLWNTTGKETSAALDLGGGSVQITFALPATTSYTSVCSQGPGKVYKMQLLKSSYNVFTHSALGCGLKSAYLYIMGGHEEIEHKNENPKKEHEKEKLHLSSPCFISEFESTWQHGRYTYNIKGEKPNVSRLDDCQRRVDDFVKSSDLTKVVRLKQHDLHLFSYFFDIPQWAGIIPANETSMVLTPSDIYNGATKHCQQNHFSKEKPFLCMSLLYIHSVLTKGLDLPEDRTLHVLKELNGRQLSWTLGSALSTLNDQFSYSNLCETS